MVLVLAFVVAVILLSAVVVLAVSLLQSERDAERRRIQNRGVTRRRLLRPRRRLTFTRKRATEARRLNPMPPAESPAEAANNGRGMRNRRRQVNLNVPCRRTGKPRSVCRCIRCQRERERLAT